MNEPDLKTTLREFKEYLDQSYESPREYAARIGVAKETIWYWPSGRRQPKAQSLARLRRFLDAEAKRPAQGDGIRPIETVPYKIIRPIQQVRYARICPFCRKARGKILKLGRFRACAQSAERPGRPEKATQKRACPRPNPAQARLIPVALPATCTQSNLPPTTNAQLSAST